VSDKGYFDATASIIDSEGATQYILRKDSSLPKADSVSQIKWVAVNREYRNVVVL
jgi:hypothetical protein